MKNEETKKKGTFIDAFVEGSRNGFNLSSRSMAPNVLFAFALIQILNLTGLTDIIGTACGPVMGIFDLPGVAATVLVASILSIGGAVGVTASLYAGGLINGHDVTILVPGLLLMGCTLQYMGRILGMANVKNKFYPLLMGINIVNGLLAMLVMRFIA